MYKFTTHLIWLLVLLHSDAYAERGSGQHCVPRAPTIYYQEAIGIAVDYVNQYLEYENYIDMVELVCEKNRYSWRIGFRRQGYESGQFVVYVFMDKTIKTSAIKDG